MRIREMTGIRFWYLPLILCLWIAPERCNSQEVSPTKVRFSLITKRDGLSSNTVHEIFQDRSGYMWIGTENGLNRYDGNSFSLFTHRPGDSASIAGNSVRSICQDPWGTLWFTTQDGHISYYKEKSDSFASFYFSKSQPGKFPYGNVRRIWFDSDSCMWFGMLRKGFGILDIRNKRYKRYDLTEIGTQYPVEEQLIYNTVYSFYEEKKGSIWISTHNGLYHFDKKTEKLTYIQKEIVAPGGIRGDLFVKVIGRKGHLYLASYAGGLVHYDIQENRFEEFHFPGKNTRTATTNIIENIQWKNDSVIWFTSLDYGFGYFSIPTKTYYRYGESQADNFDEKASFPEIPVNDLFLDRNGNMWIAHKNGISLFNIHERVIPFTKVKTEFSTNQKYYYISDFVTDTAHQKLVLAMQYGDGLHILHRKTHENITLPFPTRKGEEKHLLVNDLLVSASGTVWVVTRDDIYTLSADGNRLKKALYPETEYQTAYSPRYNKLVEARDGSIWVASTKNSVFRYEPAQHKYTFFMDRVRKPNGLPSEATTGMAEDPHGIMWFVTRYQSLSSYDPATDVFTHYPYRDASSRAFPAEMIYQVTTDNKGYIWMTTSSGLYKISYNPDGSPRFVSVNTGKESMEMFDLVFTPDDKVVFTTRSNVSVFDISSGQLKEFDTDNGLRDDFTGFMLGTDPYGNIYIGSHEGYYTIDTLTLNHRNFHNPDIAITSVKVFGNEMLQGISPHSGIKLQLSHKQNYISFEFTDLSFANQNHVQFRYALSGFEENWQHAGNRRFASYNSLPGGDYIFRTQARNDDGNWVNGPEVQFAISKAIYNTWWFYLLSSIAFTGLIFSGYQYRIRMVRREENIKSDFRKKLSEMEMTALRAQMNPHFIFNCLNSINRYIVKADKDTASLYLTKFSKLIRLILDNSKSRFVTLEKELHAIKLYIEMESLRFESKFTYSIHSSPGLNISTLEIPPLLIQPYVENAIWHGLLHKDGAGEIRIQLHQQGDFLTCVVEDNGVGRKKSMELKSKSATKDKSHGMKITSDRLEILNTEHLDHSSVIIDDLIDDRGNATGTRVTLKIKIHENNSF